ncbi:ribonuclease H-like protein [Xylariaceae sp. FL1272]|nr:ribonuclease H-like protein [Xylariaceae sp. FL1272]
MIATPPRNHRLWHPSRGISFSPPPISTVVTTQSPRIVPDFNGVGRYHVAASQAAGEHEPWSRVGARETTPVSETWLAAATVYEQKAKDHEDQTVPGQPADAESALERSRTDDPPPAVLDYQMDTELFYTAKKAALGSPESFWSYTQYRRRREDGSSDRVKVHYCRSKHTMERVCKQYFMDEKVLGFDLEWVPDASKRDGLKKNVSLIQLASASHIALFHVALFAHTEDMVGPSFRALMEDPSITKVGVAIKGDTTRLRNFLDIDSRGLMELSHMYKLVTYCTSREYSNINKMLVKLARQVEEYLHLPLFKGTDVRSSNWAKPLSMDQVVYSASDAYAGLHLHATYEHHRKLLDPCPPIPRHAELNIAIRLPDGVQIEVPEGTIEPDVAPRIPKTETAASGKYLASALETIRLEDQDNQATSTKPEALPSVEVKEAHTQKPVEIPKDSRVEIVEDRVAAYRSSRPKTRATFPQLRAYYLWHCYDLSPDAIAELVRDPPLKTATVVNYILCAVQSERLVVDGDRLRQLTDFMSPDDLWTRFPYIAGRLADNLVEGTQRRHLSKHS